MKQPHKKILLGGAVAFGLIIGPLFASGPDSKRDTSDPHAPLSQSSQSGDRRGTGSGAVVSRDDDRAAPWRTQRSDVSIHLGSDYSRAAKKKLKPEQFVTIKDRVYPLRTYRMLGIPNDPLANQWWEGSATLTSSWDIAPGSYQTTLAIIDSGFALAHEDLVGRWYQNSDENGPATQENPSQLNCTDRGLAIDYSCNLVDDNVDGIVDNETGLAPYENPSRLNCTAQNIALTKSCNRIDDDGNGYVDDMRGWDVINQDNSPQAGELNPAGSGVTHGTMVAGAAAATGNNAKGIAGANWQTKVLPIQALDDDGYGDTRSVGEAILYAVDQSVDVINVSLGTDFQDDYVREAIEAATAAGIVVVASSGNDGCECVLYPARYPEVVAVGATDASGARATFSSWGESVDIVAPGTNFVLPSWSSANPSARYVSGVAGTSFSSPLVAGVAAHLKSHQPNARPLHIIAALHQTSNRSRVEATATRNTSYGFGALDAVAARNRMITPQHSQHAYSFTPIASGGFLAGQALAEKPGSYVAQDCIPGRPGLPVYELISQGGTFFTISEVEARKATTLGYTQKLFTYACLQQPHDTVDIIRSINVFREFRNISSKL